MAKQANTIVPITPILRWAGSKRKILPTLAEYWKPTYNRYVEPFAGSAALFFSLQPNLALLGDVNSDLIGAYAVIRERPDDVHKAVSKLERSAENYYAVRKSDPKKLSEFRRAIRFVYLNRYCFNGIYRTNTSGHFNVPYAHTKPGVIPPIEQFRQCATLLHRAKLRCADFGSVLKSVRRGDFVYLDPPYIVESRRIFRQYDERVFCQGDLVRLKEHLIRIEDKGAAFVLSYADSTEARKLFSNWDTRRVQVRRNVAGFVSARRLASEIIVTNVEL